MLLPAAFVLGLNEAVTLPRPLFSDPEEAAARLEERARLASEAGADAVRIQTSSWPWLAQSLASDPPDFTRMDAALELLGRHGLDALVVVAPWPPNKPWLAADDCRIYDRDGWTSRVRQLVERYDRDGVDDAPEGARVLAWEVHNEPDLHEYLKPGFCPPETYRDTLALTASAVREADPDAVVVSGGIYRPATKTGLGWMQGLDGAPEAGAAGIHLYPSEKDDPDDFVERAFANVRTAFGERPVWVTEASITGEQGGVGEGGEADQARALVDLVVAAYAAGAVAFFWHTLADPPDTRNDAVPHPGLFAVTGVTKARKALPEAKALREKPAAEAFRRLRGLSGEVGRDGDLRWVRVDGGWLVWPAAPSGDGKPPAPVAAIAGGAARMRKDGSAWVRGLAFAPLLAEEPGGEQPQAADERAAE
jgi:hypothetical protein